MVSIELSGIDSDYHDLVDNTELSDDEKVFHITQRMTTSFEELVKKAPEQWFWFHRRWKTTPEEGQKSIYD